MTTLQPSAPEIGRFVRAIFRHADEGTFISLRAFDQEDRGTPPVLIEGVAIGPDAAPIVARAATAAGKAANAPRPAVFAPPVATFNNPRRARSQDVANGVALSVELDAGEPARALAKLEFLLGPATVVLSSGGEWADPGSGELHAKQHFHWRLTEPTRTDVEHGRLREARWLAAVLVGGDRTAAPPAHPLRWPGSWNLKRAPRLAGIVTLNEGAEIDLGEALDRLQEAVEAAGLRGVGAGPHVSGEPQAPVADIASALAAIPNSDLSWDDWNRMGMATWRATGGASEGLEAWADWSAKSGKHTDQACTDRWQHFGTSPPLKIGAGTIFFLARAAGWQGRGRHQGDPPPFAGEAEAEAPPTSERREPGPEDPKSDGAPSPSRGEAPKPRSALWMQADDWDEAAIPQRPWLARDFVLRRSVTAVAGLQGGGKSSLMVGWAVAAALGRPLGAFRVDEPCRVLTYNVEDDADEQKRRFSAALRQHGLPPAALKGRVLRCGPHNVGTLIEQDPRTGAIQFTQAWEELEQACKDFRPGLVLLDPLVELHTSEENDNTALRRVIAIMRAMAQRHDCGVVVIHHVRKGAVAGDMDGFRGAGSITGAARVALTSMPMTKEEAGELGVPEKQCRYFFRVDGVKANYSPPGQANWYELASYELDNGDDVAAAVAWTPPTAPKHSAVSPEVLALVAADVSRGSPDGPYSARLAADQARSVAAPMMRRGIVDPRDQKAALRALLTDQGFVVAEWKDANRISRSGLRSSSGAPKANWTGNSGAASERDGGGE